MANGNYQIITPTILIGLGGIGSRVVDSVYQMLPVAYREQVVVHAFDTNVNDIQKLQHLKGKVTQTSTDMTVGQYLYKAGETVWEWFPKAAPELQIKTLTEGAGQIRLVSRLAYRSAMEAGKLGNLNDQLTRLFQVRPDEMVTTPRIMIVTSLAGGTGSGIFLQVAMYLRWVLETILGRQNIYVRGAFLLPDVLIKTNTLKDEHQNVNVRANGYACLKELEAIVANARAEGNSSVTIELEFRPFQRDASGRPNFAIPPLKLPYNYVFLYDFENAVGHNLVYLANYERQMAKAIYLQLFTPMANQYFSVEDNRILQLIQQAGRSRYCGAGVATLSYPYDDLLNYLTLCWAAESISDHWLRLDNDYQQELVQYQRDLENGVIREKPERGPRYISLLQNYGEADRALPFFRLTYNSCFVLDRENRRLETKASRFVKALEELINKTLQNDGDLKQAEADCELDEGKVAIREQATREVERRETALEILKQKVLARVQEHMTFIVNQALWYDCDVPGHMLGNDYQLNTWLLGQPAPLHPVAVRFVLYQIHQLLQAQVKSLTETNKKTLEAINRYANIYDLEETDIVETAGMRLRLALQQGSLRRLWNNMFKEFIEEYKEKSDHQYRNLVSYKTTKLKELVFMEVAREIQKMLEGWELFFENLRETHQELLVRRNKLATTHTDTGDSTQLFVLAMPDQKKRLWEDWRPRLISDTLPDELAKEIYLAQFAFFCQQRRRNQVVRALKTTTLFHDKILPWCRRQLQEVQALDLNIFRALQREAETLEYQDEAVQTYVAEKIRSLRQLAQPFIPPIWQQNEMIFWGINDQSAATLTEAQRLAWFGGDGIFHAAFSPYEIICYRSFYGLQAEDFPKFSAGDPDHGLEPGVYFQAYRDRIRELAELRDKAQEERTITPHLDKHWHLPAFMPDLNQRQVQADLEKIDRALIHGLIHGFLRVLTEDNREVWFYSARESGLRSILVNGRNVRGELYLLHEALAHNPNVVEVVLDQAVRRQQEDLESLPNDFHQHRFVTGCLEGRSILDRLLTYHQAAPHVSGLPEKGAKLLTCLLDEIEAYFLACYGSQSNTARQAAANLIKILMEKSQVYQNAAKMDQEAWFAACQEILNTKLNALAP